MTQWLLKDLNDPQREAVTATEGPVLVIAGAGSGKTRVLTNRLAYILTQRKAEPYQILAVTFTNKAAGEMKERVAKLLGGDIRDMNVSTFHSFCARFLRREAEALGYSRDFTIFDETDSLSLIKNCIKELGFSDGQFPPKGQRRKISDAKNKLLGAEDYAKQAAGYFDSRTAELYTLYQRRLRECNGMDFDDLLFNTVRLLKDNNEVGQRYRNRFKYILVDEYQDTNHVQYLLLRYLVGPEKNICVVGDEDQSIYGWRGADISNILNFEKDFPGAKVVKLERNYRSTNIILKAASAVIAHNQMRKGKELWSDTEGGEKLVLVLVDSAENEAQRVIDIVESRRPDIGLNDMVILYRTNAQSRAFEEQLRRRNLPYQIIGGVAFYQRKEIKDLMAYLKLIANPKDDVSFGRIVNYPRRGIGAKTLETIAILARENASSYYEIAASAGAYPELSGKEKRLKPFTDLIKRFIERRDSEPIDLLTQDLVEDLGLLQQLVAEDPATGQTKVENIEAFIEGTAEFARANTQSHLTDYLAEISLYTDIDSYREVEDKLTLMTIHSAKGLEFDTVFIAGLEEGLLPLGNSLSDPAQLEEERRLFYVGATRARRRLYLSSATARYRFGEVESLPSRFIKEIPEELIEKQDLRTRRRYDSGEEAQLPIFTHGSTRKKKPVEDGVHYEYEDSEVMRAGRIVIHPTFGRGKIVRSEGFGDSLRLEIMFSGVGVKKIMAKFAKLKVVG